MSEDNFIECDSIEGANVIDLSVYTFIGLRNNAYCFKIRQRK